MSLTTSAKAGSSIAPIEAGTYPAICYGVVDIGYQYSETYKKSTPKIVVLWEIPSEKITINDEEVSRTLSQTYTSSLNEKAALRRDLAAWRGRDFTEAELERFDLRNVIGVPCLLNIIHKEYNGNTYANIAGVMKMPKGMPAPVGTLQPVTFDLDYDSLDYMENLPEWIVNKIKASETYKDRIVGRGDLQNDENINDTYTEYIDIDEDDGELSF